MAQVVLENIVKTYGAGRERQLPVSVLADISLAIADQEFMVLVGPSGCGKSTLLRLIAGLEQPTAGKIWVGDRCVNALPPKARDIAMVFQSYALYPHLSVADNLAFGLRRSAMAQFMGAETSGRFHLPLPIEAGLTKLTQAWPKGIRYRSAREMAIQQRIQTVAQMLQIEPLLNRYPKQLSGGQKQRVALGRAMARNPQAFLMDEPLSNLDAKLRTETRAQIVQLQRQLGVTTIYVTHDQTEAMTMGDRIVVLNGGQIQQLGTPLDLYQTPANRFVAEFIGSPPMNFMTVQVQGEQLWAGKWKWSVPQAWSEALAAYQGQNLSFGVRPEALVPTTAAPDHLPATVVLVEALGHETSLAVELKLGDQTLAWRVRVAAQRRVEVGESLWLDCVMPGLHLFDPQTGLAILPQ